MILSLHPATLVDANNTLRASGGIFSGRHLARPEVRCYVIEVAKRDERESTQAQSSDFDAPLPPEPSALETAATIGGVVALGAAVIALGADDVLRMVNIPGWSEQESIDVQALEKAVPGLDKTSAPEFSDSSQALCSSCTKAVPYDSMAINEHGYFCVSCVVTE